MPCPSWWKYRFHAFPLSFCQFIPFHIPIFALIYVLCNIYFSNKPYSCGKSFFLFLYYATIILLETNGLILKASDTTKGAAGYRALNGNNYCRRNQNATKLLS